MKINELALQMASPSVAALSDLDTHSGIPDGYPLSQRIFFHHTPKTGGTSFLNFAEEAFSPRHVLKITNVGRVSSSAFPRQVERWNIRFIIGHVPPQIPVLGGPYARVSFVRNPESLLLSQFCWQFERQFERPEYGRFFAQRAAKKFFTADDLWAFFRDVKAGNLQTRFFANHPEGLLTRRQLDDAIAALKAMTFVGTQDHMGASIDAFRITFGVAHRQFLHYNMTNHDIVKLTDLERAELAEKLMPYDNELYQQGLAQSRVHQRAVSHLVPPGGSTIMVTDDRRRSLNRTFYRGLHKDLAEWRELGSKFANFISHKVARSTSKTHR